jgi:hypothetical protein
MSDEILFRFVGPRDADGKPTEWVPGIPARDLTAGDVERVKRRDLFDTLKGLAIYEAVKPAKKAADAKEVKGDA